MIAICHLVPISLIKSPALKHDVGVCEAYFGGRCRPGGGCVTESRLTLGRIRKRLDPLPFAVFIGIQLRNSGLSLKQILLNKHGMVIAAVIILTSWLGGVIAAWLLDMPIYQALAMASGFGWYSLAGILVGDAFGPVLGGASFMIELLRELVALVLIPMLIRRKPVPRLVMPERQPWILPCPSFKPLAV